MANENFNNTVFSPPVVHPVFFDPVAQAFYHFDGKTQNSVLAAPGSPTPGTPVTLTSGTAVQNTASVSAEYYISITGAASGTVKIDIGPTASTTTNVIPVVTGNGVNSNTFTIKVPASWYIKVTVVNATIVASSPVVLGIF